MSRPQKLSHKESTLQDIPSRKGLVLSMPLNNGFSSGASIFDESESGFTGTATNSPVLKYPGMEFTGTSFQYIDIGAGPSSVSTVSLWTKVDDILAADYCIDLNGTDYLYVFIGTLTKAGFAGGTTVLYTNGYAGTTVAAAKWHHIAITDTSAKNASDLDIARLNANYLDGSVADVLLYNRVLGSDEMLSIYMTQKHKYKTW